MTREECRTEIEAELGMPLDRIFPPDLYEVLVTERCARREAEARVCELEERVRGLEQVNNASSVTISNLRVRVKELEEELAEANDYLKELKIEVLHLRKEEEP